MGFDTWQYYTTDFNQQAIVDAADMLVKTGLNKRGYNYVTVSEGWNTESRDANGNLVAESDRFPKGIAWLANYVHSKGLKFGIYGDIGTVTCAGRAGMFDHYQQDIDQFAAWGVDYIWLDACNVPFDKFPDLTNVQVEQNLYGQIADAIRKTGRPMVDEVSAPAYFIGDTTQYPQAMAFSGRAGNLFRIGRDISDSWASILNNYADDTQPNIASYAGPGHWNSPDWLLVGNQTAEHVLTPTQERSQFSLWAELAAPLLFSADPTKMSSGALETLSNSDVIAVDQDPLGAQGKIVQSGADYDVLAKPLANGDVAVTMFNHGSTTISIVTTAHTVGLRNSDEYVLRNLWTKTSTVTADRIPATVAPDQVVMYRVSPGKGQSGVSVPTTEVPMASSSPYLPLNTPTTVTADVRNDAPWDIQDVTGTLSVPAGWTVRSPNPLPSLGAGQSAKLRWTATPPSDAKLGSLELHAKVTYRNGHHSGANEDGSITIVVGSKPTVSPAQLDTKTQGDWVGQYGTAGYDVAGWGQNLPAGVTADTSAGNLCSCYQASNDVRYLQAPSGSSRVGAVWYGGVPGKGWPLPINFNDSQAHRVSLYLLDPDGAAAGFPRTETLTVRDLFGNFLETIDPGSTANGVYATFTMTGGVVVTVNDVVGSNSVLSGIFMDPPS
jgi:alpha-galactosidase